MRRKVLLVTRRSHRVPAAMPPAKRFEIHINLGLTRTMVTRLDRVLDKDKGETRAAAIREAIDEMTKNRETKKKGGRP